MKTRISTLLLVTVLPGCQTTPRVWEVSFNVAVESKLDEHTKVAGGLQVRPATSPPPKK
jgi:hypothetical protein